MGLNLMHISIENAHPCEAATVLRSHVYHERILWLMDEGERGQLHIRFESVESTAPVRVRCGNPSTLGEVVTHLASFVGDVIVDGRGARTDDTIVIAVPVGVDSVVAIALFRAICFLARPSGQLGPAPQKRRWFLHAKDRSL